MPKRTDIKSIMIIGAGPIVIGQACEFDYSGAQACKALREEGYRVVLVNSNPATIMTDPNMADATYIEPITPAVVAKIILKERPDALLPTMGGQTGLNTALAADEMTISQLFEGAELDAVLEEFGADAAEKSILEVAGVEMIGAKREAIEMAEDRQLFREAMDRLGIENPKATIVTAPTKDVNAPRPLWRRSLWINPCWVGKNTKWKLSAIPPTTPSSSVPSKTWTQWACIRVIPSPWPLP